MEKDTTRSLSKKLEKLRDERAAGEFIKAHADRKFTFFYEYLGSYIAEHNLKVTEVIERSGISRNYVYNILNGNKLNPGRDKLLALCIGAKMKYSEIQKALEIAGAAPLYPRDERDVRIAVCINNGIESVSRLNLILDEYGLMPLDV